MWEEEEEEWWDTFLCISPFLSFPKSMIALIGFFVRQNLFYSESRNIVETAGKIYSRKLFPT